jgi:hypothetical protein
LNKNIRYCQNSSPYNIFQEDENNNEYTPERSKIENNGKKEQPSLLSGGKIKFSNKFNGRLGRGTRGLDIIVDEEEENDAENDYIEKHTDKINP